MFGINFITVGKKLEGVWKMGMDEKKMCGK
jgi:hypothetical protein